MFRHTSSCAGLAHTFSVDDFYRKTNVCRLDKKEMADKVIERECARYFLCFSRYVSALACSIYGVTLACSIYGVSSILRRRFPSLPSYACTILYILFCLLFYREGDSGL
jgi:hypothetical protein